MNCSECLWYTSSSLTTSDILIRNPDVQVSVRSAVLMPPPQSMKHLVHHNTSQLTSNPNGKLLSSSNSSNIWIAPGRWLCHKDDYFARAWTIKEPHLPYKTGLDVCMRLVCYDLPRPSKEFHVVGFARSWHKSDTTILFILLDCPANGGACSWAWGGIKHAVTALESLLRAPPDAHCTLLTKTWVYHVWHSSIGPELKRYASHSSFDICGVLLSVEARFHCQPLVWRENNVSAEVVNVGESCMQKCKLQCMLDCIYSLIAARLTQIQIPHLILCVFLMHLPAFMSSSFAELCSSSPAAGTVWGSSTALSASTGSAFTTASKHTARVKAV